MDQVIFGRSSNRRKATAGAEVTLSVGNTQALSYHVHVDAVGVRPGVLEVLLQPLPQRVGNLVEADEFFDSQHLQVVSGCARIQPLDDSGHIPKDAGVHESWGRSHRGEP